MQIGDSFIVKASKLDFKDLRTTLISLRNVVPAKVHDINTVVTIINGVIEDPKMFTPEAEKDIRNRAMCLISVCLNYILRMNR